MPESRVSVPPERSELDQLLIAGRKLEAKWSQRRLKSKQSREQSYLKHRVLEQYDVPLDRAVALVRLLHARRHPLVLLVLAERVDGKEHWFRADPAP